MVYFRKRLSSEILIEINELILNPEENGEDDSRADDDESGAENEGTLMLDSTYTPSEIKFPQDTELLNECREKLKGMIDTICEATQLKNPHLAGETKGLYQHQAQQKEKRQTNSRNSQQPVELHPAKFWIN